MSQHLAANGHGLPELTDQQFIRYSRSIMLHGETAQQQLGAHKVLIVGLGGLGAPLSLTLAAAGVGQLLLCDDDAIELSNLARQTLYEPRDCGEFKAQVLAARLKRQNPNCQLQAIPTRADAKMLASLGHDCSLWLDCSDNLATRLLLAQQSRALDIPLFGAAVSADNAQLYLFDQTGPCYQCVVGSANTGPANCQSLGVDPALVQLCAQQLAFFVLQYLRATPRRQVQAAATAAVASHVVAQAADYQAAVSQAATAQPPASGAPRRLSAALPLNQLGVWRAPSFMFYPVQTHPSCACCGHRDSALVKEITP